MLKNNRLLSQQPIIPTQKQTKNYENFNLNPDQNYLFTLVLFTFLLAVPRLARGFLIAGFSTTS